MTRHRTHGEALGVANVCISMIVPAICMSPIANAMPQGHPDSNLFRKCFVHLRECCENSWWLILQMHEPAAAFKELSRQFRYCTLVGCRRRYRQLPCAAGSA